MSELDRELYLFDSLASRCSYDTEAASNGENWKAYTQYGALVDGKAVCEGYARAMQSLLSCGGWKVRSSVGLQGNAAYVEPC